MQPTYNGLHVTLDPDLTIDTVRTEWKKPGWRRTWFTPPFGKLFRTVVTRKADPRPYLEISLNGCDLLCPDCLEEENADDED